MRGRRRRQFREPRCYRRVDYEVSVQQAATDRMYAERTAVLAVWGCGHPLARPVPDQLLQVYRRPLAALFERICIEDGCSHALRLLRELETADDEVEADKAKIDHMRECDHFRRSDVGALFVRPVMESEVPGRVFYGYVPLETFDLDDWREFREKWLRLT